MVVAKFKTVSNEPNAAILDGKIVTMFPVMEGSSENDSFYTLTPGGTIQLSTINADAAEQFVPNEEKFILFMSPEEYAAYQGTKIE